MIMQVNQVVSNGRNQFEILENGLLLYRASSPFFKPGTPVGGDEVQGRPPRGGRGLKFAM